MEDKIILTTEPCCDVIPTSDCNTTLPTYCQNDDCDFKNIDEHRYEQFSILSATLQDSVMHSWRMHLKAKKYSVHVILEEYYNEAFEMIDALIEHYQGICNCNIVNSNITVGFVKSEEPFTYFSDLKYYLENFVNDDTNFNEKTFEIKSDIDDILRLIDSTLYKLGHLTESKIKSFDEFIYENL